MKKAALIALAVAVLVPAVAAAVWFAAPEEIQLEEPAVTTATEPSDAPADGMRRDEPAEGEQRSDAPPDDEDGAVASNPHPGRMAPAARAELLAAVDEIDDVVPEADLAAEGRVLFRSAEVAKDGESCQSCHTDGGANAELGIIPHPTGTNDFTGPRESQALWGVRDTSPYRWDGGVPTLEEMAGNTITTHFKPAHQTDVPRKTAALVAYMSTLDPPRTAFDRGRMSAAALRGKALFDGKAGCISCHGGPLFTDNAFHLTGVPQASGANDPGAARPAGAFNTQQLRDVAATAPYMHNGTLATLHDVVEFYDEQSELAPLNLTPAETDDLVEFLESL